jgi:uncharacterized protein YdgA (DUF945 family)
MNPTDIALLESIRAKIESMNKERHIQALNILAKYPTVTINEQKFGQLSINLSCIPKEALEDLCKFVSYVDAQELSLMEIENQKRKYQTAFFHDGNNNAAVAKETPSAINPLG